jgi:RNA polymerase sigma-70 factor (ECF subfamily)
MERVPAEETDEPFDAERLQGAIDGLADEFKLVVMLYYFEERSYRDMAEILEVPVGTVMSRLSRAKAHLRSQLAATSDREEPEGGTVSTIDAKEPKPPVLAAPPGRA